MTCGYCAGLIIGHLSASFCLFQMFNYKRVFIVIVWLRDVRMNWPNGGRGVNARKFTVCFLLGASDFAA